MSPPQWKVEFREKVSNASGTNTIASSPQLSVAPSVDRAEPKTLPIPEEQEMMSSDPLLERTLSELEMRLQTQLQRLLAVSISREFEGARGVLQQAGMLSATVEMEANSQLKNGTSEVYLPNFPPSPMYKNAATFGSALSSSPRLDGSPENKVTTSTVADLLNMQAAEEEAGVKRTSIAGAFYDAYNRVAEHCKDDDPGLTNYIRARQDDRLQVFCESRFFQVLVFIVIVAQSVLLGIEAQTRMSLEIETLEGLREGGYHDHDYEMPQWILVGTIVFHVFFCIEILVRLFAWKREFFNPTDREFFVWNLFDITVLMGLALEFADVKTDVLRAFRLLRVARVLRIFRMFEKLRKMIYALMHSAQALFWLIFMLGATLYVFALAFMQGAYRYLHDMDPLVYQKAALKDFEEDHNTWVIVHRFRSLGLTMRSLFASLTGGDGWDAILEPVIEHSWWYSVVAVFFVFFFVFAVLNIVTGVFVEEAMNISQIDKDIASSDLLAQERQFLRDVQQFVQGVDSNQDGILTYDELKDMLGHDSVQRWLVGLDIDLNQENMHKIIAILDDQNTGEIDHAKFFDVLTKLKGQARSVDLFLLAHDIRQEQKKLRKIIEVLLEIQRSVAWTPMGM